MSRAAKESAPGGNGDAPGAEQYCHKRQKAAPLDFPPTEKPISGKKLVSWLQRISAQI